MPPKKWLKLKNTKFCTLALCSFFSSYKIVYLTQGHDVNKLLNNFPSRRWIRGGYRKAVGRFFPTWCDIRRFSSYHHHRRNGRSSSSTSRSINARGMVVTTYPWCGDPTGNEGGKTRQVRRETRVVRPYSGGQTTQMIWLGSFSTHQRSMGVERPR